MDNPNIKAVLINDKSYDKRYAIVDVESGEILDDAQGYGYKSKQKAYAAYYWKNRPKEVKQAENDMIYFFKKNKKIYKGLEYISLCAFDYDEEMTEEDIIDVFESHGKSFDKLPFTAKDVLKKWAKLKIR